MDLVLIKSIWLSVARTVARERKVSMNEREIKDLEILSELRCKVVDGIYQDCPCAAVNCPQHGNCTECTAIHRNNRDILPACMRSK